VIYAFREDVDAGGLMSYGPNLAEVVRIAGTDTGRILKGRKPPTCRCRGPLALRWSPNQDRQGARPHGAQTLLALADKVIRRSSKGCGPSACNSSLLRVPLRVTICRLLGYLYGSFRHLRTKSRLASWLRWANSCHPAASMDGTV
jgi:hypothetical protein